MASPEGQNFIRITVEDANSEHVESLLRRQMSLRGERGITSLKKRKWYYSSWFVLMIAAGAMSLAAWALLEPYFPDVAYVQGPITSINLDETLSPFYTENGQHMKLFSPGQGYIQIANQKQKFWFVERSRQWSNRKATPLVPSDLKVGQQVRAYVDPVAGDSDAPVLIIYVDPSPPHLSAGKIGKSLEDQERDKNIAGVIFIPLVAGFIGIGMGAADGIICRMPRRALLAGGVGLIVGLLGGFVSAILAGIVYMPLTHLAAGKSGGAGHETALSFIMQMGARGLAWLLAGTAMGVGQGIALRSKRLLLYGFLGGIVGGLLGGLLFDPIATLSGKDNPDGWMARMIGFTVIGLCVGAMTGIVELLARDAWLRMTEGPLTGKEFLLFKDTMRIGSSSKSDIYLFNDPQVSPQHAIISTMGDTSEIDASKGDAMVLVNSRPTRRTRLRHGDQITIGRTSFLFQTRKG